MLPRYFSSVDELPRSAKLYIYGIGGRGQELAKALRERRPDCSLLGFIDSIQRGEFAGYPQLNLADVTACSHDWPQNYIIAIASLHWAKILDGLASSACADIWIYGSDQTEELPFLVAQKFCTRSGIFVEAGANDGMLFSNTYLLEKFCGWKGLLVEPVAELADECRRNRPNAITEQVALVAECFSGNQLSMKVQGLESQVVNSGEHDGETVKVSTATLASLLDKHHLGEVDLLVLDIEGQEISALEGLNISRRRPRYLLLEERTERERAANRQYLSSHYTLIGHLTRRDSLYELSR